MVEICSVDENGEDEVSVELGIVFVVVTSISVTNVVLVLENASLVVFSELFDEIDSVSET